VVRNIQIPERPVGLAAREASQVGDKPIEKITLTAQFDAASLTYASAVLAMGVGIGPQLAALEMMVRPKAKVSNAIMDLFKPKEKEDGTQKIPRENYPRILFVWGPTRLLPVAIESMSITEQKFDFLLNPVRADVALSFAVTLDECGEDKFGKGALAYTNIAKEILSATNLINSVQQAIELLPL